MFLIKLLAKIAVMPFVVILLVFQWAMIFLVGFSAWIFHLLTGIIFTISVLAGLFWIAPWVEVLRMLTVSFSIFLTPHLGEWLTMRIVDANLILHDFIKS